MGWEFRRDCESLGCLPVSCDLLKSKFKLNTVVHLAKYSNSTQWCGFQWDITRWHIETLIISLHWLPLALCLPFFFPSQPQRQGFLILAILIFNFSPTPHFLLFFSCWFNSASWTTVFGIFQDQDAPLWDPGSEEKRVSWHKSNYDVFYFYSFDFKYLGRLLYCRNSWISLFWCLLFFPFVFKLLSLSTHLLGLTTYSQGQEGLVLSFCQQARSCFLQKL